MQLGRYELFFHVGTISTARFGRGHDDMKLDDVQRRNHMGGC